MFAALAKEAIKQPERIPSYVSHNLRKKWSETKYNIHKRKEGIPGQKELIHDLIENEEFVLIILDSCRFDYFEEEFSKYITGDLSRVWSAGNRTPRWTPNTWDREYDLDYLSGIIYPVSSDAYNDKGWDFDPEATFKNSIHVVPQHGPPTLSSKMLTEFAIQHFAKAERIRSVVHYPRPHQPYVGKRKIFSNRVKVKELVAAAEQHGFRDEIPDSVLSESEYVMAEEVLEWGISHSDYRQIPKEEYRVQERIADGRLTDEELREAYRENLRHVLSEVKRLVKYLDCTVVVSADHGEHLGAFSDELPGYCHPDYTHPVLREVPWFIVDDKSKNKKQLSESNVEIDRSKYKLDMTEQDVREQLRALGYR